MQQTVHPVVAPRFAASKSLPALPSRALASRTLLVTANSEKIGMFNRMPMFFEVVVNAGCCWTGTGELLERLT